MPPLDPARFEPVIGLEVHAELQTASKMFCGCEVVDVTRAGPNTAVCEVCVGLPGSLPAINQRAVEYAVRVALALHCTVQEGSVFARKNYFYPDLPKGYQISQYELPLATNGWLEVPPLADQDGSPQRIRIRRVHLEEDTGKLSHRQGYSLVDYNRSGVPLIEIVTEPDMHSVDELKAFAVELRTVLRYVDVTSGDMEKGAIRFEANISVRPQGTDSLGTRTEIKNLNSFRALVNAVTSEISRQSQLLSRGERVVQETLGWDDASSLIIPQRSKEEAHDYRYFPEPDLPPLAIDPAWVEQIRHELPELPGSRRERFVQSFGLARAKAQRLVDDRSVAGYFEEALAQAAGRVPADKVANWVLGELAALLHESGTPIEASRVGPDALASSAVMAESGEISLSTAKDLLAEVFARGGDPRQIVARRGLAQVGDEDALQRIVNEVLASHPDQVATYRSGKASLFDWLFGQAMRKGAGRANPAKLRERLRSALDAVQVGDLRDRNAG